MLVRVVMLDNTSSANDLVQTYCDQSPASRLALRGDNQLSTQKLPKVTTEQFRKLEVEFQCGPAQVIDFKRPAK